MAQTMDHFDVECQRQFGDEKYSFFNPIAIKSLVVHLFTISKASGVPVHQLIVYNEVGEMVDPRRRMFSHCPHLNRHLGWSQNYFYQQQVVDILRFLENTTKPSKLRGPKCPELKARTGLL